MSDARWGDPRDYDARDRVDEWPRVCDPRDRVENDPRDGLTVAHAYVGKREGRLPDHRFVGRPISASDPASPKLVGERRGEQGVARGVPLLESFLPIWMADPQITFYIVSEQ